MVVSRNVIDECVAVEKGTQIQIEGTRNSWNCSTTGSQRWRRYLPLSVFVFSWLSVQRLLLQKFSLSLILILVITILVAFLKFSDVGWLETFDSYYYLNVSQIIPGVIDELSKDPKKTFIWAEIAYFKVRSFVYDEMLTDTALV